MKTYDFGFARVTFDSPGNKVQAMISNADAMSQKGWELKAIHDAVSEVYLFYQKEIIPTPAVSASPIAAEVHS